MLSVSGESKNTIAALMQSEFPRINPDWYSVWCIALSTGFLQLSDCSDFLRANPIFVMAALSYDQRQIAFVSTRLINNREFISLLLKRDPEYLFLGPRDWQWNPEYIRMALEFHPSIFLKIDDSFRKREDFVLQVLPQNPWILAYIPKRLQKSKKIASAALEYGAHFLQYFSLNVRDDIDIMKRAVSIDGLILRLASGRLKNMQEVVILAVRENGQALEYASDQWRGNMEVVSEALKSNLGAWNFVSRALKNNPEITSFYSFLNERDSLERDINLGLPIFCHFSHKWSSHNEDSSDDNNPLDQPLPAGDRPQRDYKRISGTSAGIMRVPSV